MDDVFLEAGGLLARLASDDDRLYDQDQLLSVACLLAGGRGLSAVAASDDTEILGNFLRSVQAENTLGQAGRSVMACSWYFLFHFAHPHIPAEERHDWVTGMVMALAPASDVQPVDEQLLGPLFDTFVTAQKDRDAFPRFGIRFTRWFWLHTTVESDERLVLASVPELMKGCQSVLPAFQSDLVDCGLL